MDRREQILQIIRTIAEKNVNPEPDESLFDSGLLDSFALPDMIGALETKFGLKIPDSDLMPRKFDTIEKIEAYLDSHS